VSTDRQSVELALLDTELDARAMVRRGFAVIALIPPVVSISILLAGWLDAVSPLIAAGLYALFGGFVGAIWLGVGLFRSRRAKRELQALLDEAIPKARLLK
jgi:hypothetical protein